MNPVRFAVDGMLGRLAKYLRALGYDTSYRQSSLSEFIEEIEKEDRIFITKRRDALDNCSCRVITPGEGPVEVQLGRIIRSLRLKPDKKKVLTICLTCNVPTQPVPLESVESKIPDRVKKRISSCRFCPECNKIFWWGSHADRMMRVFEKSGVFEPIE